MQIIISGLLQTQNDFDKENSVMGILLKQQKQVETALNNLVNAVERGIISNTTNKRLHELEKQQEQLERQILIERNKTAVKIKESDIRQYYEQALKLEPQMLISYLIKQIVIFDDKIEIHYNSPIKSSPDNNGLDFLFYSQTTTLYLTENFKIELYA